MSDADRHPGIRGIHQIHVPVQDLDRATTYYRDVLGIPYLFTAPPGMAFSGYGSAVALDGDALAVGVPAAFGGGAACVYRFDGAAWALAHVHFEGTFISVPGQVAADRSRKLKTNTTTASTSTITNTGRQPTRVPSVPPMRKALTPDSARADPSEPTAVACCAPR